MARILLAFDRSPGARAALSRVVNLFQDPQLCMVEAVRTPDGSTTQVEGPPPWEELLAATERDLQDVAREAGIKAPVETRVNVGDAAEVILAAAADWKPDVLAIGTHERGMVSRLILGSVAENVMKHCTCPVLVVRTKA